MGRHDYISTFDYELDSGCYFIRLIYKMWEKLPQETAAVRRAVRCGTAARRGARADCSWRA